MNEVNYIKKKDLIKIREYFSFKNKPVILNLINFGCNVTLRISDLLNLKFEDINNNFLVVKEIKTGKSKTIKLNKICQQSIADLKNYYKAVGYKKYNKGYIFKSQFHKFKSQFLDIPINRSSVSRYLTEASDYIGLKYKINTHSFRKTWGYNVYTKTKDIGLVMKALNHSSESVTLRYIGITQDRLNDIYDDVEI